MSKSVPNEDKMLLLTKKKYDQMKEDLISNEFAKCVCKYRELNDEDKLPENLKNPKYAATASGYSVTIHDILEFVGAFIERNFVNWSLNPNSPYDEAIVRMLIMREYNTPSTLMCNSYYFEGHSLSFDRFKEVIFLSSIFFDFSFRTYKKENIFWLYDMFERRKDHSEEYKKAISDGKLNSSMITKIKTADNNIFEPAMMSLQALCRYNSSIPMEARRKFCPCDALGETIEQ